MSTSLRTSSTTIAVVGASGLVGEALLRLLAERGVPSDRIRALASARSVGDSVPYGDGAVTLALAEPASFEGCSVAFFAATGTLSRELAPSAIDHGAFVVDKSATFRRDLAVPLVVPAVNGALLDEAPTLVASPNCTAIGVVHALEPLRRRAGIRSVTITTLQAASGAGRAGTAALAAERRGEMRAATPFAARLADSVVPLCGAPGADGASEEEHKLRDELRRLLELPQLELESTCIRVPVDVGHTASLRVSTEQPISLADARRALEEFPEVTLVELPTPASVAGTDRVEVGRLRLAANGDLLLVQCADNLRRGAATNALDCAERLLATRS